MKTDIEDEETVGLPGAVTKIEFQGWQRRSSGKFTICYLVFLRKRRRWAFLNTLQALDPPIFKSFGLTLPTKRLWASLIYSKTARYRLFLAVVRCCVTTTLAAETFSLLSVYLNYKFGLGLPSFYLFFSLFNLFDHFHINWRMFKVLFKNKFSFGVTGPSFIFHEFGIIMHELNS